MSQMNSAQEKKQRVKVYYGKKQFYGKTKKEAIQKRDKYIQAEKQGMDFDLSELTFTEYGLKWLKAYRAECNPALHRQYENMVLFTGQMLKNKPLRSITVTDMQSILNSLKVYSASYINKYLATMKGIFRTAHGEGALLRNPMELIRAPKGKKTEGHRALEPWERNLITETCQDHDFGLAAMVMMYAGLRRGEALYLNVDRDVDFKNSTITVNGAVSFSGGNQPEETDGKSGNDIRRIPLVKPLADALKGHHGLICAKEDGTLMSQCSFDRKYDSYITFLETKINGCHKRWYGKTKEHKALLAEGKELPPWKDVNIRCHDFRVDFCTRCYHAGIPTKTLQSWMGHASSQMILEIYAKMTKEAEEKDAAKLHQFIESAFAPDEIDRNQPRIHAS